MVADFERNLASMTACEGGHGGYEAVMYRSFGNNMLWPHREPLGGNRPTFDTPEQLHALLLNQEDRKLPRFSAVDILRTCQRAVHHNGERTISDSSRLELLGSVVLATQSFPLHVRPIQLRQNTKHSDILLTREVLKKGEDFVLPLGTMVQDRIRTQKHRDLHPIFAILRADASTPGNEVFVGIWDVSTTIMPYPLVEPE